MIDDAQIEGFTSTVFSLCTEKNVHFERATFFCSVNKDSIGGQWGLDPRDFYSFLDWQPFSERYHRGVSFTVVTH